MNLEILSQMIGELVLDRDVVVLPGFGAFIVEDVPAAFTDRGYTLTPPYRKLSFRQQVPDEDSSLVEMYAGLNHIETSVSRAILSDFLSQLGEIVLQRKTVQLPGLGRLRSTSDGRIFFVQDEGLDIFPDGIALEPVSLKTKEVDAETVDIAVRNLSDILSGKAQTSSPATCPAETDVAPAIPESSAGGRKFFNLLLAIVAVFCILVCLLAVLGRVAPDFVDRFLYTPEELEIIKSLLQ